ncbi:hypothetical protein Tco_1010532 [Tanacetum coccineum]
MERGLRQGDPLSLFLFLIVVEALQMAVLEACCKGIFKGIPNIEVREVASSLGCIQDSLSFMYLGLPGFKESQRGISWVKWNSILLKSNMGGLGVGSLLAKNLGLLGKWKWCFLTEKEALW